MTQEMFERELAHRADGVHGPPLSLDDVRGRAQSIRRRRRAVAAGAVAAAVAVALIVPALLSGPGGHHSRGPEPAPSPTKAVDPGRDGVPVLREGVITYEDGTRITPHVGNDRVLGFAPLGTDRWIVTTVPDDGQVEAVVIDDTGRALDRYPMSGALVTTADRQAAAWVDPQGAPQVLVAGAEQPRSLPRIDGRSPIAVALLGQCPDDCRVVGRISGERGLGHSWSVSTDGEVDTLPDAVPAVVDATADGGLLAAVDGIADDDIHSCSGVFDVDLGDYRWHGCNDNVYEFAPDGGLVATTFAEGLGPTGVTIRDALTGDVVGEVKGDWISSFVWEDASHLLLVDVSTDGTTVLERWSPDGVTTVERGPDTAPDRISPSLELPLT